MSRGQIRVLIVLVCTIPIAYILVRPLTVLLCKAVLSVGRVCGVPDCTP